MPLLVTGVYQVELSLATLAAGALRLRYGRQRRERGMRGRACRSDVTPFRTPTPFPACAPTLLSAVLRDSIGRRRPRVLPRRGPRQGATADDEMLICMAVLLPRATDPVLRLRPVQPLSVAWHVHASVSFGVFGVVPGYPVGFRGVGGERRGRGRCCAHAHRFDDSGRGGSSRHASIMMLGVSADLPASSSTALSDAPRARPHRALRSGESVRGSFRARSSIRRYDSGLMVVGRSGDRPRAARRSEWIPHEFEHVIEQLDGHRSGEAGRRSRRPGRVVLGWVDGRDRRGPPHRAAGLAGRSQRSSRGIPTSLVESPAVDQDEFVEAPPVHTFGEKAQEKAGFRHHGHSRPGSGSAWSPALAKTP